MTLSRHFLQGFLMGTLENSSTHRVGVSMETCRSKQALLRELGFPLRRGLPRSFTPEEVNRYVDYLNLTSTDSTLTKWVYKTIRSQHPAGMELSELPLDIQKKE